jgi:hypothetical protein
MDEDLRTLKRTKFAGRKHVYPKPVMDELRGFFTERIAERLPGAPSAVLDVMRRGVLSVLAIVGAVVLVLAVVRAIPDLNPFDSETIDRSQPRCSSRSRTRPVPGGDREPPGHRRHRARHGAAGLPQGRADPVRRRRAPSTRASTSRAWAAAR